jgi:hypothetical protein
MEVRAGVEVRAAAHRLDPERSPVHMSEIERRADGRDPLIGDRRFGCAVGMTIGVIGVLGTLQFNGVF